MPKDIRRVRAAGRLLALTVGQPVFGALEPDIATTARVGLDVGLVLIEHAADVGAGGVGAGIEAARPLVPGARPVEVALGVNVVLESGVFRVSVRDAVDALVGGDALGFASASVRAR